MSKHESEPVTPEGPMSVAERYRRRALRWRFPRILVSGTALVLAVGIGVAVGGTKLMESAPDIVLKPEPLKPPSVQIVGCTPDKVAKLNLVGTLPNDVPEQLLEVVFKGPEESDKIRIVYWYGSEFFLASNTPGVVKDWYRQDDKNSLFREKASLQEIDIYLAKVKNPIRQPAALDPQDLLSPTPWVNKMYITC